MCVYKIFYIFCDVFEKVVSVCVYFWGVILEKIFVGFVFGKCKVVLKSGYMILRLEFCVVVLVVEFGEMLFREFNFFLEDIKYYFDSKVVLGYLFNECRWFYVYVCNCVFRI